MHCIPAETTAIKKIKFCVYETGKIKTWNRLKDVDVLLVLTKIKAPLHYPGHKWATLILNISSNLVFALLFQPENC